MKIWIDADAAPYDVKAIIFKAAKRLNVETIMVANQLLSVPIGHPMIKAVQVREGANEADKYIVVESQAGDLAITADLPLASDLVEKGLFVIDPRGDEYSPDTIAGRRSMRDFMDTLRGSGAITGGAGPYSELDKKAFASTFDRLLTKAIRQSQKEN